MVRLPAFRSCREVIVFSAKDTLVKGASVHGNSIQKALPSPTLLFTPMEPFMACIRRWQSARPSPVPWTSDCSAPKRSKGVNTRESLSLAMPDPVSRTVKRNLPSPDKTQETVTFPPIGVYLTAFVSTFSLVFCLLQRNGCIFSLRDVLHHGQVMTRFAGLIADHRGGPRGPEHFAILAHVTLFNRTPRRPVQHSLCELPALVDVRLVSDVQGRMSR